MQEFQNFLKIVELPTEPIEVIVDQMWAPLITMWLHKQFNLKEKYLSWQDTWEMNMPSADREEVSRLSEGVAPIYSDYADIIGNSSQN
jgi:hypothetical protein